MASPQIGITLCNSSEPVSGAELVTVEALDASGIAAAAGLQVGYAVLAVNGHPVTTHSEAIQCINGARRQLSLLFVPLTGTPMITPVSTPTSTPVHSGRSVHDEPGMAPLAPLEPATSPIHACANGWAEKRSHGSTPCTTPPITPSPPITPDSSSRAGSSRPGSSRGGSSRGGSSRGGSSRAGDSHSARAGDPATYSPRPPSSPRPESPASPFQRKCAWGDGQNSAGVQLSLERSLALQTELKASEESRNTFEAKLKSSFDASRDAAGEIPEFVRAARTIRCDKSRGPLLITVASYPLQRGVLLTALGDASEAARGGLRVGDVIVSINSQTYSTPPDAIAAVDFSDDIVVFEIARRVVSDVTLDKLEGDIGITMCNSSEPVSGAELVTVEALDASGIAAAAGLQVGYAVLAVNGHPVTTHSEAIQCIDDAPDMVSLLFVPICCATPGSTPSSSHNGSQRGESHGGASAVATPACGTQERRSSPSTPGSSGGGGSTPRNLLSPRLLTGSPASPLKAWGLKRRNSFGRKPEMKVTDVARDKAKDKEKSSPSPRPPLAPPPAQSQSPRSSAPASPAPVLRRMASARPETRTIRCDKSRGDVPITVSPYPMGRGMLLMAIEDNSEAVRAGLRVGDVIMTINSQTFSTPPEAIGLVDSADILDFEIARGLVSVVTLDKSEGEVGITMCNSSEPMSGAELVTIEALEDDGLASEAGLQAGCAVLAVNGEIVTMHFDAIRLIVEPPELVTLLYVPLEQAGSPRQQNVPASPSQSAWGDRIDFQRRPGRSSIVRQPLASGSLHPAQSSF